MTHFKKTDDPDDPPLTYEQLCARIDQLSARVITGHQDLQALRAWSQRRFGRAPDVPDLDLELPEGAKG